MSNSTNTTVGIRPGCFPLTAASSSSPHRIADRVGCMSNIDSDSYNFSSSALTWRIVPCSAKLCYAMRRLASVLQLRLATIFGTVLAHSQQIQPKKACQLHQRMQTTQTSTRSTWAFCTSSTARSCAKHAMFSCGMPYNDPYTLNP